MSRRACSAVAVLFALVASAMTRGSAAAAPMVPNEIRWTSCDGGAPRSALPADVGDARMRAEYAQFARGGIPADLIDVVAAMRSGRASAREGEVTVQGVVTAVHANGFTLARASGGSAPFAGVPDARISVEIVPGALVGMRRSQARPVPGMSLSVVGRTTGGTLRARVIEDAEAVAQVSTIAVYTSCNPVEHRGTIASCTQAQLADAAGPASGAPQYDERERREIEDLVSGVIAPDLAKAVAAYRLHGEDVRLRNTFFGVAERASGGDVLVKVERDPLFGSAAARTAPQIRPGSSLFVHEDPGAYAIHHTPVEAGERLRVGGKRDGNALFASYVVDDRLDDVLFAARSASRVCNKSASAFTLPAWRIALNAASPSPSPAPAPPATKAALPSFSAAAAPPPSTIAAAPPSSTPAAATPSSTSAAAPPSSTAATQPPSSTPAAAPPSLTPVAARPSSTIAAAPSTSAPAAAPPSSTVAAAPPPSTISTAPPSSTPAAAPPSSTPVAALPSPLTAVAPPSSATTVARPSPVTAAAPPSPALTAEPHVLAAIVSPAPRTVAAVGESCYVTFSGRVVDAEGRILRVQPASESDARTAGLAFGSDGGANVIMEPHVTGSAAYVQPAGNDLVTFAGYVESANFVAVGMSSSRSTVASAPCPPRR